MDRGTRAAAIFFAAAAFLAAMSVASLFSRFAAGFVLLAVPSVAVVAAILALTRHKLVRIVLLALVAGPVLVAWVYLVTFGFVLDEH